MGDEYVDCGVCLSFQSHQQMTYKKKNDAAEIPKINENYLQTGREQAGQTILVEDMQKDIEMTLSRLILVSQYTHCAHAHCTYTEHCGTSSNLNLHFEDFVAVVVVAVPMCVHVCIFDMNYTYGYGSSCQCRIKHCNCIAHENPHVSYSIS